MVDHVDFDVRRGEIVCIAGIDGNGQTELVYALTGLVEPEEGTVTLTDRISPTRPSAGATRAVWGIFPRTATAMALCWIITLLTIWCCKAILSRSSAAAAF